MEEFVPPVSGTDALFSCRPLDVDQLKEYARANAKKHLVKRGNNIDDVLSRFKQTGKRVARLHKVISDREEDITIPIQEWSNDFYLLKSQVNKIASLIRKVDTYLPRIIEGPGKGELRILHVMSDFVRQTNAQIDFDNLLGFVKAYQRGSILLVGEVKSIRVMVKLSLIDSVTQIIELILSPQLQSAHSARWRGVRKKVWLRNCVSSLQLLDTIDWHGFNDLAIGLDNILQKEQAGFYASQDYHTRDLYRTEIGLIAAKQNIPETKVAEVAVCLANRFPPETPEGHIGFYLVGRGRDQLDKAGRGRRGKAIGKGRSLLTGYFYLLSIILGSLAAGVLLYHCWPVPPQGTVNQTILFTLLTIAGSHVVKMIVDSVAVSVSIPRLLPRLDFSKGIPSSSSTLVVVPALISETAEIHELIDSLEINFLANKHKNLYFGLLTDFKDAAVKELLGDALLLTTLKKQINRLNDKYGKKGECPFYLFHRARTWNARDKVWMGYERKRGKLMDLSQLLRERESANVSCMVGDRSILTMIKYVITLDADTQLPREMAWKMVGTMAHPLNRPVYCRRLKRITDGYGMLQPQVRNSLTEEADSRFGEWSMNRPNIDPYTQATPNIYQDLFGEGSFIGKGIFDVDAILKVLEMRFPENRVLSHDLLEGAYLRSGLLSDVTVYEPASDYVNEIKRRHRWIRGDWQIAAWAGPFIPGHDDRLVRNPLSALSRWKIADNLITSLLPVIYLLLLIAGVCAGQSSFSILLLCAFVFISTAISFLVKIASKPARLIRWDYWRNCIRQTRESFFLSVYELVCLPFEAINAADAIFRANWRTWISRRGMLEWVTYRSQLVNSKKSFAAISRWMWRACLLVIILAGTVVIFEPQAISLFVLSIVWLFSPAVVWYACQPPKADIPELNSEQSLFLGKTARRTWAYFDDFITEENNWLPPDHYQQYPASKLADYTSPTNLGLGLLAGLTGSDFGFQTKGRAISVIGNTLKIMQQLERYKGHFYNWYNLRTLQPSLRYVSTVDSGNLAGHLLVLRQGMVNIRKEKLIGEEAVSGLKISLLVLEEELSKLSPDSVAILSSAIAFSPDKICPAMLKQYLDDISLLIEKIPDVSTEIIYWKRAIGKQCQGLGMEIRLIAPWLWMDPAPEKFQSLLQNSIPDMDELLAAEPAGGYSFSGLTYQEKNWLDQYTESRRRSVLEIKQRIQLLDEIIRQCAALSEVDYNFLYDPGGQLLSIGYHVEMDYLDVGYYDVLCSEARLASYLAVCQNQLPVKSWFALGRPLLATDDSFIMLSANGTMFEYLMPMLVMPSYGHTLIRDSCKMAVRRQIDYTSRFGYPWGISESAYATLDDALNYQYKVFGIPDLSLKHVHTNSQLVIAPYASAMALMIFPGEACNNLQELQLNGARARYGFFEAVDYSMAMESDGTTEPSIVRSFMVHHQGMSLLAFSYVLLNKPMQRRFCSDPELASSLFLLQERMTADLDTFISEADRVPASPSVKKIPESLPPLPEKVSGKSVQLLSNGSYRTVFFENGTSYSQWEDISVNGVAASARGVFCLFSDLDTRSSWSATLEPLRRPEASYTVSFPVGHALFNSSCNDISVSTDIMVLPDKDIELRRLHICNNSSRERHIEFTVCMQALLANVGSDDKDSMDTSSLQVAVDVSRHAICCGRSYQHPGERDPRLFLKTDIHSRHIPLVFYEKDSPGLKKMIAERVGKQNPVSTEMEGALISMRFRLLVEPGESVMADIMIGVAGNKMACDELLTYCCSRTSEDFSFSIAEAHGRNMLQRVNADEKDLRQFQQLAAAILHTNDNAGHVSLLYPRRNIVVRVHNGDHIDLVEKMIKMHAYWRSNGLRTSLFIWNEDRSSYRFFLQRLIMELITNGIGAESWNRHEGVFLRSADNISKEDQRIQEEAFSLTAAEYDAEEASALVMYGADADEINRGVSRRTSILPL